MSLANGGAVDSAKKISEDVKVVQVAGPEEEIKKWCFEKAQTESFAKESWRLAGHLDWWKMNLPAIFDKRDIAREQAAMPDALFEGKPVILLATGGVSSKFRYTGLLKLLLKLRFVKSRWEIIDLGAVKAHRLYDLIGYMEKARVLVTTDSALMHLARAVPALPVVALQSDTPGLWNGSPWRPEHIWTCRYRDFPRRAPSMIEAMENWYHGGAAYNPCLKREGLKVIHAFSAYSGIAREAKQNWKENYRDNWIHTPIFYGAFGRDSQFGGINDRVRFPFVKDVIRAATLRADAASRVVLTRGDTCFQNRDWLENNCAGPLFSHRCTKDGDNLTRHPAVDLFAFTKAWWQEHVAEFPDMIMDNGEMWGRALKELIVRRGGVEAPFLTWQAEDEK